MKPKNPEDYKFLKFVASSTKHKKYDAILKNKQTGKELKVPFGDKRYEQYKDKALGLYKHKDHLDTNRRSLYRKRHKGEENARFSSGYFAYKYLW